MRINLLLSTIFFISFSSFAEVISLEYKGFYDRLKVLKKGDYHLVDIAFTVPNLSKCKLTSGTITTDNKQYPLTFSDQQRLYIPFDDELKRDRALVNLDLESNASACGIAIQVRAKNNARKYSGTQLAALKQEMDLFLDKLQGFPLKYFRQPIHGLAFDFGEQINVKVSVDHAAQPVEGKYQLSHQQLSNIQSLTFSHSPLVVSPWVQ